MNRKPSTPPWQTEQGAIGWVLVGVVLGVVLVIWLIVQLFQGVF